MTEKISKIKIHKFNPSVLQTGPHHILIVGKRGTGKSTLVKDLMSHMSTNIQWICMHGAEDGSGFYRDLIDPCNNQRINLRNLTLKPVGLVLDDCGYDKKITTQLEMRHLFVNGHDWNVNLVITQDYLFGMQTELRTTLDYIFFFREAIVANQKRAWDCFFRGFPKFAWFQEVFLECTEDFNCLVIQTKSPVTIEDSVFYYKASSV
jgi:energy-coupling factor transporter ATP-binding protein EcfA2